MSLRFAGPYETGPTLVPSELRGKILCIAFSPLVDYVATGSDDRLVTVWNTATGVMEYQESSTEAITSILWHPSWRSVLFIGCEQGAAFVWNFRRNDPWTPVLFGVRGAIRALTYNATADHLAAIASSEVHVARAQSDSTACWVTFVILPAPQDQHEDPVCLPRKILPTGIHFLRHGRSLIVSYLAHGIICWDVYTSKKLWTIQPLNHCGFITSSALSPDEKTIAISNGFDGVDLYPLSPGSSPVRRYRHSPAPDVVYNLMTSVTYAHNGHALVSGSPRGSVNIWDEATEELLQSLVHKGKVVQTVSAALSDTQTFIATAATVNGRGASVLTLWKAKIDPQARQSSFGTIYRRASIVARQTNQWIESETEMIEPWLNAHPSLALLFVLLPIILASYSFRSWFFDVSANTLSHAVDLPLVYWNVSVRYMWTVASCYIIRVARTMGSNSRDLHTQVLARAGSLWHSLVEHVRLRLRQWLLEPPV